MQVMLSDYQKCTQEKSKDFNVSKTGPFKVFFYYYSKFVPFLFPFKRFFQNEKNCVLMV